MDMKKIIKDVWGKELDYLRTLTRKQQLSIVWFVLSLVTALSVTNAKVLLVAMISMIGSLCVLRGLPANGLDE